MESKLKSMFLAKGIQLSFGLLLLFGCCNVYHRDKGCMLDGMSINGDVTRVETIVQSSIPLTELSAKAMDFRQVASCYAGNMRIDFDCHGNVKRTIAYGIDGKILFDEGSTISGNNYDEYPAVLLGAQFGQRIDKVTTSTDSDGNKSVQYFEDDQLLWNLKLEKTNNGSQAKIVKEYAQLKKWNGTFESDTTYYKYLDMDNHGNWTEAEVTYKGVLPRHSHSYRIKRRLTYVGEAEKKSLIDELLEYNNVSQVTSKKTQTILLGEYGKIIIPQYMGKQSSAILEEVTSEINSLTDIQSKYLMFYKYAGQDAYATISVNLSPGDGKTFDDNILQYDDSIEEMITQTLAQSGTHILKWQHSRLKTVSGHKALLISYYRYGNGSPTPVYCENYTFPMSDGNNLVVVYSFQSDKDYMFRKDFDNAIESIEFF